MRFHRPLVWLSTVAAALLSAPAVAQSSRTEDARGAWMLGLGAQFDEEESDSLLGTLYVGVGPRTWLTFVAGQSSSPADRADIDADTLAIGVDHRFEQVGFTVEAERWGDSDALETEDFGGSVYFDRERWRVGLGYRTRDIEIPFTLTGQVSADSVSVDARFAVAEHWQLYLGLAEHDYERDLNVLPRVANLNLLSTSTLTLANSFLDHERYVAVDREFGRVSLNVRLATDRSAVDDSKFDTREAAVLFPIGDRVDLEVNVGNGKSDFFDSGWYGGLLFLIYGR
jgi:opacity protein-like surface antigen